MVDSAEPAARTGLKSIPRKANVATRPVSRPVRRALPVRRADARQPGTPASAATVMTVSRPSTAQSVTAARIAVATEYFARAQRDLVSEVSPAAAESAARSAAGLGPVPRDHHRAQHRHTDRHGQQHHHHGQRDQARRSGVLSAPARPPTRLRRRW